MIQVFQNQIFSADANMRMDEALLNECDPSDEIKIHLYKWAKPSLTYGYFIDPKKYLNCEKIEALGLEMGRRPTGGGIIFHLWDLSFGVVVPANHPGYSNNTLKNYSFINNSVIRAVKRLIDEQNLQLLPVDPQTENISVRHFCMAKPTIYDVMLEGKKIAGAAQRKKPNGYLHQGTISLTYPDENLLAQVLLDPQVLDAMRQNTFALVDHARYEEAHQRLGLYLIEELQKLSIDATLTA